MSRRIVEIAGIGPGSAGGCSLDALDAIRAADVVVGAKRMLYAAMSLVSSDSGGVASTDVPGQEDTVDWCEKILVEQASPSKILAALDQMDFERACVICSGDTGFYSLATSIRGELAASGYEVRVIPGISTVQYLAAKLQRPWQHCVLRSAHGRSVNVLGEVLANEEVFFLTGGDIVPSTIVGELVDAGLGDVEVTVAENLSYPEERIVTAKAGELVEMEFSSLSSVWIRHGKLRGRELDSYPCLTCGIPDEAFERGKVPMTKQEVRAAIMGKLQLGSEDIVYDVGAGTGSVSIEIALASPMIRVFSVEVSPEACDLIESNRMRFGAYNMKVIRGSAPDALTGLPAPDVVFIGGSRGNFGQIVDAVLTKNPSARIVASAIAMETIAEASKALIERCQEGRLRDFEASQVSVARTRQAGGYHLLTAQNPIVIFSATGAACSDDVVESAESAGTGEVSSSVSAGDLEGSAESGRKISSEQGR
ncbi:MAG: precorrin-6y C5,15-methyltransferase (decarboxylating) subunit CbiE [Coriobacteriales bacterium]